MKTQIIMLTALIAISLVFASMHLVAAEDNVSGNETPVLISANPDTDTSVSDAEATLNENEDVSSIGMGLKQVGIWFTFNQEKKARLELELAKLQLVRAKIAARNNNTLAMEKALEAHERIMERVQTRVDKISNSNAGGNLTGLDRAIAVHEARIQKMNGILENANLTEAQRTRLEARLAHTENVTAGLKGVQAKIQQKVQELEDQAKAENKSVRQVIKEDREELRNEIRSGVQAVKNGNNKS